MGSFLLLINSCQKNELKQRPSLTITAISNITSATASSGGSIVNDGGSSIKAKGVCWSIGTTPTISDNKTNDGTGTTKYTSALTGLAPGTVYNIRAYATNTSGTGYSSQLTFTTVALAPVLTTAAFSAITTVTATSGGNITSDGGSPITAKGVCWSTAQSPTIADTKTADGTGANSFSSAITGLTHNTTYYVRAYATNRIGTSYGNQLTLITLADLPVITTSAASSITATTAISGGNISLDGGATITARGICWSTTANPTISGSTTTDGNGSGIFISNITALLPATLYYVRAYATNSAGTAYGDQISFTTAPFVCGNTLSISHVTTDGIAPVKRIVNYGTVTTNLSGANKCWITQNLGATTQASSATDATDAASGWYWQFNRKQGYAVGPNPVWTTNSISESSDWLPANDPCTLELGTGWRIPTHTEWTNASSGGAWGSYTDAYNSVLKIHAAGTLSSGNGVLDSRGSTGSYWNSTQKDASSGWILILYNSFSGLDGSSKASGLPIRCIKD